MVSELDSSLASLTGARQTMSSWARVIEAFEEIPEIYRASYRRVIGDARPLPYTVHAPPLAGTRHRNFDKILCEAHDTIYVWEQNGRQVTMTAHPLDAITDLEVGCILLYSWFTISGLTQDGSAASTTVEFNTASGRHVAPFLNRMRPAPCPIEEGERRAEWAKFDPLAAESFKFANYARDSLVDGETVRHSIWQPQICRPALTFCGRILRRSTLSLAHLTVLTDRELIFIQDDRRGSERRGIRHGGKWDYIPLEHLGEVALRSRPDDLLILTLTLVPGGRQLELLFDASRWDAIVELQDGLKRLKT